MSCHILPPWQPYQALSTDVTTEVQLSPVSLQVWCVSSNCGKNNLDHFPFFWSQLQNNLSKQRRQRGWQRGVCFYLRTTKEIKREELRPLSKRVVLWRCIVVRRGRSILAWPNKQTNRGTRQSATTDLCSKKPSNLFPLYLIRKSTGIFNVHGVNGKQLTGAN